MGFTVDLDHEHARNATGEVDNVAADYNLPAELGAAEPLRTQGVPKPLLERRLLGAQPLCMVQQDLITHIRLPLSLTLSP